MIIPDMASLLDYKHYKNRSKENNKSLADYGVKELKESDCFGVLCLLKPREQKEGHWVSQDQIFKISYQTLTAGAPLVPLIYTLGFHRASRDFGVNQLQLSSICPGLLWFNSTLLPTAV